MIQRLIELRLRDFRVLSGEQVIPMDGDAVIIHGPNGSGKTALLSAIELAITGGVADLGELEEDYPRCLTHVDATTPGSVSLAVRAHGTSSETQVLDWDLASPGISSGLGRLEPHQRHFSERCYLSQYSLARLLEMYEREDQDSAGRGLAKFVQDLLGVGFLGDLFDGLHEAGDMRRLVKGVPTLARLRDLRGKHDKKLREIETDLRNERRKLEEEVPKLQGLLKKVGDPLSGEPLDSLPCLEERIQCLSAGVKEAGISVRLKAYDRAEDAVSRMKTLLEMIPEDGIAGIEKQAEDARIARRREISGLRDVLLGVRSALGIEEEVPSDATDLAEAIGQQGAFVDQRLSSILRVREKVEQLSLQTTELESRRIELEAGFESLGAASVEDVSQKQEWAAFLGEALRHVQEDQCPVCDRDFGEVSTRSLQETLLERAEQANKDFREVSDRARDMRSAESEIRRVEEDLSELHGQLSELTSGVDYSDQRLDDLRQARDRLEIAMGQAEGLSSLDASIRVLEGRLKSIQTVQDPESKEVKEIEELASEYGASIEGSVSDVVNALETEVRRRKAEDHRRWEMSEELGIRLREIRDLAKGIESLNAEVKEVKGKARTVGQSLDEVDEVVARVRGIRNAASEVRTDLVNNVFSGQLNGLWRDLFSRLVRHETFTPELMAEEASRGLLRTSMRAAFGGEHHFRHLRSVLSSGNLNTAALSLFLALHLLEEPLNRILVLDDPVQNMDDIHVVELANLLRMILRDAGRQVIVAVHEPALRDFLLAELAPQREGRCVLSVEVDRLGSSARAHVERVEWKPDSLEISA